ncbi:hypothetical protein AHAS_Ahas04G0127300 [Arachis hypogaea]
MLWRGFISVWWWFLKVIMKFTIAIELTCIRMGIIPIGNRRLLPRRVIKSLTLLPSLIVPSLMHVVIENTISYNIIVTTLIAKRMRIHSRETKTKNTKQEDKIQLPTQTSK